MSKQSIAIVADRSGSMRGKEVDTSGGINTCIQELLSSKNENDIIKVTLKLFDHEQMTHWDSMPIENIPEFLVSDFIPRGQTALLDAMGDTIKKYIDEKELNSEAFDSCCIYIVTDGYENASKNWNRHSIKELIKVAEENYNIKVSYLAANQDAILEAASMGISSDRAINYSEGHDEVQAVYRAAACSAFRTRSGQETGFIRAERQASQPTTNSSLSPPRVTRFAATSNIHTNQNTPLIPTRSHSVRSQPHPPSPINNIPEWKQHQILDAGKNRQWDVVEAMLRETPDLINVEGGSSRRWTLLHQAAESNNYRIVEYLLSKGADKFKQNRDGNTAYNLTTNTNIKDLLNPDNAHQQAVAVQ